MSPRAVFAFALVAWPAFAQESTDLAPDSAPAPEARPEELEGEITAPEPPSGEPDLPGSASEAQDGAPALIPPEEPQPDDAPSDEASEPDPAMDTPDEDESTDADESPVPPMREVLAETPEELAACLAELDALGVTYERTEPLEEPGTPACGIANPVTVSEIAPGVALEPASPMRCATALATARWVADVVVSFAPRLGRGEVTVIDQGDPYVCRPRADGQMSEHAWGNALDVIGFRFSDGEAIPVVPRAGDGTIEEAFQRAVRAGACLDFETVLGPGSDEDHADHLHFDIRARNGGFRICE